MNKMVMVRWIDSGGTASWQNLSIAQMDKVCVIDTIGYLVTDDEEKISIAQSYDEGNNSVNHLLTIPKVAVQSIRYLRLK